MGPPSPRSVTAVHELLGNQLHNVTLPHLMNGRIISRSHFVPTREGDATSNSRVVTPQASVQDWYRNVCVTASTGNWPMPREAACDSNPSIESGGDRFASRDIHARAAPLAGIIPSMRHEALRWRRGVPTHPPFLPDVPDVPRPPGRYPADPLVADHYDAFADALEGLSRDIEVRQAAAGAEGDFDAFNPRNLECSVSL